MQWKGLALGEPPSWSWLTPQPGKYDHGTDSLVDTIQFHSNVFATLTQHIWIPTISDTVIPNRQWNVHKYFITSRTSKWTNVETAIWFRTDMVAKLPKTFCASLQRSCPASQLFSPNTSCVALWRIQFQLTDLTSQDLGNGWGCLIQRCLNVSSNDQLSRTFAQAALRSGDTVTSDRIERCCYC